MLLNLLAMVLYSQQRPSLKFPSRSFSNKKKKKKKRKTKFGWRSRVFKWASQSRRLARREQSCSVLECLYESSNRSWSRWGCRGHRNAAFAKNSHLGCRSCPNSLSSLFDKHRGSSLTRTNRGICWICKKNRSVYPCLAKIHIQASRAFVCLRILFGYVSRI